MKKLLTVSLFAIMAVSAANADIASTDYVDSAKSAAVGSAKEYTDSVFGNTGDTVGGLVTEVEGLQSSVETIQGTLTSMDTAYKAADEALDGRVDDLEADNTTNKSNISTLQSEVAGLTTGNNSVAKQIETALTDYSTTEEMDAAIESGAVNTVSAGTTNGTILVDGTAVSITGLKSAAFTESSAYDVAGSAAAAQSAAEAKVTELANGAVKTNTDAIAAMDTAYKAADEALDGRVDDLEADNTTNKSNISSLQTAVENLNTGTNSVSSQIATALETYSTTAEMNEAITDDAVNTVASGSANGTIAVDGVDVAVKGLGSAAYTESSAYDAVGSAAAAQSAAEAKVTALANGAVKSNTDAIAAMDTAYKAADAATLNSAKAFTSEQIEALGQLATIDTACAQGVTDCALVIRSGEIKWEKVSY